VDMIRWTMSENDKKFIDNFIIEFCGKNMDNSIRHVLQITMDLQEKALLNE
jgi:hypothetical protein